MFFRNPGHACDCGKAGGPEFWLNRLARFTGGNSGIAVLAAGAAARGAAAGRAAEAASLAAPPAARLRRTLYVVARLVPAACQWLAGTPA